MTGHCFEVAPVNRWEIRAFAETVRRFFGLSDAAYFPVADFLEFEMEIRTEGKMRMVVWENHEMEGAEGYSFPKEGLIILPTSVYLKMQQGDHRARFTGMHEFSHVAMNHDAPFQRARQRSEIPAFKNSEWQADRLAGEILAPPWVVQQAGGDVDDLMELAGMSRKAAEVRISICKEDGLI